MESVKILTKDTLYERVPFLKHYEDVSDSVQHALDRLSIDPEDIEIYAFKYTHDEYDVNIYLKEQDKYVQVPSVRFVSTLGYTGADLGGDNLVHVFELTNIIEPDKPDYMDDEVFKRTFGEWSRSFHMDNSFKDTLSNSNDEDMDSKIEEVISKINEKLFFMEETLTNMGVNIYKD